MASIEERLAEGRALADEAWARTLRAMYEGGLVLAGQVVEVDRCTCGTAGAAPYGHEPGCGLEFVGLLPIESDALDRRDEARREREDAAREGREP